VNKLFATGELTISAEPDRLFRLISDPPTMAGFAEETVAATWIGAATSAAPGVRFKGYNRRGRRRWHTICEVVEMEPGRRFAYHVDTPFRVPVSRWQYDIAPSGDGTCTVTETNWLRAPLWFIPFAILITGVLNRPAHNAANITTTLRRLKEHVESADEPSR
jgi:uncharacterized protein YndB with AHSA1/START domain